MNTTKLFTSPNCDILFECQKSGRNTSAFLFVCLAFVYEHFLTIHTHIYIYQLVANGIGIDNVWHYFPMRISIHRIMIKVEHEHLKLKALLVSLLCSINSCVYESVIR